MMLEFCNPLRMFVRDKFLERGTVFPKEDEPELAVLVVFSIDRIGSVTPGLQFGVFFPLEVSELNL